MAHWCLDHQTPTSGMMSWTRMNLDLQLTVHNWYGKFYLLLICLNRATLCECALHINLQPIFMHGVG